MKRIYLFGEVPEELREKEKNIRICNRSLYDSVKENIDNSTCAFNFPICFVPFPFAVCYGEVFSYSRGPVIKAGKLEAPNLKGDIKVMIIEARNSRKLRELETQLGLSF